MRVDASDEGDDRTALIAGAGGNLGAAVARRFADAGLDVALCSRSGDPADDIAAAVGGLSVRADVTDAEAVADVGDRIRAALGGVDVLVHNASALACGDLRHCSPSAFERTWRTRALGAFALLREFDPSVALVSGTNYASDPGDAPVDWASAAPATRGLCEAAAADLDARVVYVEIAAAVAPPESDFAGAVNAADLADRYLALLDGDDGFEAVRVAP